MWQQREQPRARQVEQLHAALAHGRLERRRDLKVQDGRPQLSVRGGLARDAVTAQEDEQPFEAGRLQLLLEEGLLEEEQVWRVRDLCTEGLDLKMSGCMQGWRIEGSFEPQLAIQGAA